MLNANATSAANFRRTLLQLLLLVAAPWAMVPAAADTHVPNTAFQSGETLQYDLYYNWKFVWVKAGSASMSISSTTYQGRPAFRTRLLTRGSSQADKFFVLRDTLTSVVTAEDMLPRTYSKTDMEGDSYRQRHVWFSYPSESGSHARQQYINPKGAVSWKEEGSEETIYDMLSIMLQARSFDATGFQKGHKIEFTMTDGSGMSKQTLIYRGKKDLKMKNGDATYRCLVLSFVEYENGKEKEVVTFYVTDDLNHIPVRLDMYLRIGAAKAYLVGAKGVRNPMAAKLK